jgi:carbon-monoxide dehydrogenase small subunit
LNRISYTLKVNGKAFSVESEARKNLADALREDCGLTGTHVGCEHGVCGACTVLVEGKPVRACLMFAVQAQGKDVRTVEGLADGEKLHPLQQAFWEKHGLQCGFCTPGMIMTAADLLRQNPDPSDEEIRHALEGNLCRCTGYVNIVAAIRDAAATIRAGAPAGAA